MRKLSFFISISLILLTLSNPLRIHAQEVDPLLEELRALPNSSKVEGDIVTIKPYTMVKGDTWPDIWEGFGQKFKLKEMKKYNPQLRTTFCQPGLQVYVPVHSKDPKYATKRFLETKLTISANAPAGALVKANFTRLKIKHFAPSDRKKEGQISISYYFMTEWMTGVDLGIRFIVSDANTGKELLNELYYQRIKKDNKEHSGYHKIYYSKLPHQQGLNLYNIRIELSNYNTREFLDGTQPQSYDVTWNGDMPSSSQITGWDAFFNTLGEWAETASPNQQNSNNRNVNTYTGTSNSNAASDNDNWVEASRAIIAKESQEEISHKYQKERDEIRINSEAYKANDRLYNSYASIVSKMDSRLMEYNERDYKNAKKEMKRIREENNSHPGRTQIVKSPFEDD